MEKSSISTHLTHLHTQIRQAEQQYQRPTDSVDLLAVSKTQPIANILAAVDAGQNRFGESVVQEALLKISALQSMAPPLEWHFIGRIQSNKTQDIATHFAWVHGVDRLKIAQRLSEQRPKAAPALNVLLQVNIDGVPNKAGVLPHQLAPLAHEVAQLPGLNLRGLMAIPEPDLDVNQQRHYFRQVRQLQESLTLQNLFLDTLSMGMSGDFEAAIAEGATLVRLGTALFGKR